MELATLTLTQGGSRNLYMPPSHLEGCVKYLHTHVLACKAVQILASTNHMQE